MKERNIVLDFLRGMAILLVMLRHTRLTAITTKMGWIGVDLFFVLSGFLVSGLLFSEFLKTGSIKPLRFLIRRGFKIYPLFYTVLLLHIVYNVTKGIPVPASEVFPEIFFYQNYIPGIMGISWSLAIEEHFYILLGTLLWILSKRKLIKKELLIPGICFSVSILCLALRYFYREQSPFFDPYIHFFPTHIRADSLSIGVFIAWLYHFRPDWLRRFVQRFAFLLLLLIPLFLLPAFIFNAETRQMTTWGFSSLYLGFGCLLVLGVTYSNQITQIAYRVKAGFLLHSIAWTGVYSYSIYLLHMKAGPILSSFVHSTIPEINPTIIVLLGLVFNIGCGYLLSLIIEKPFLRMREKYYPAS